MTNPGCKGCTERYVTEHSNCHATCEKYLKWQEERQKVLIEKHKEKELDGALIDMRNYLKRK